MQEIKEETYVKAVQKMLSQLPYREKRQVYVYVYNKYICAEHNESCAVRHKKITAP